MAEDNPDPNKKAKPLTYAGKDKWPHPNYFKLGRS